MSEGQQVRILILDDHLLFREGLVRLLELEPGIAGVTGCASATEAIHALKSSAVDVVLLDFDLGMEDGLDFFAKLKNVDFAGRVLVLTAGLGQPDAFQLMKRGARGIVHKNNSPAVLLEAIRKVMAGEICLDAQYSQLPEWQGEPRRVSFTERDRQVLRGVFEGMGNKEIGQRLQISEAAVKASLQQLFHKTGVRTRAQLVRVALERYREEL